MKQWKIIADNLSDQDGAGAVSQLSILKKQSADIDSNRIVRGTVIFVQAQILQI
jgi:hypothetical protein